MKYSIIILISVFLSFQCKKNENHKEHDHSHHEEMKMGKVSEMSLYGMEMNWTDSSGKVMDMKSLRGKPVLIIMIYGTCRDICPILVENLKKIENTLGSSALKVQFVVMSFDSEKDTPSAMNEYGKKANIAKSNWFLLSGSPDSVKETAALLGVKYKKEENGTYSHSNIITLLNPEGEISFSLEGLNKDPSELLEKIKKML